MLRQGARRKLHFCRLTRIILAIALRKRRRNDESDVSIFLAFIGWEIKQRTLKQNASVETAPHCCRMRLHKLHDFVRRERCGRFKDLCFFQDTIKLLGEATSLDVNWSAL